MLLAWHAVVLGLVEGITEFLPISSTGHMILAAQVIGIPNTEFLKSFEIFIQLGAIMAVLAVYWRKLFLSKKIFLRVAVAFIPTAVIGLLVYKVAKQYLLGNISVVVWALLIGGVALIVFERIHKGKDGKIQDIESMSYGQAALVGVFQSLAIVPGVSRSAATIVGGLLLGMSRTAVVEFSFLLAIPTMAAAVGLDLLKSAHSFTLDESLMLALGFCVAFVSALAAIRFLLRYVQRHSFASFGVYRVILALVFLFFLI